MLPLQLCKAEGPLSILLIGAHPDDIEIGAGGTLLMLADRCDDLVARYVVLTGSPERHVEAREAVQAFLPGIDVGVDLYDFPDGRLPTVWNDVKDILVEAVTTAVPDVIIGPSRGDAHQDHRTISEIVPTVSRDGLYLGYEIPKWDGDLEQKNVYVPLPEGYATRKVDLLEKCFSSQQSKGWWDAEVFLGLARMRGVECRARYAEAFTSTKLTLAL